MDAVAIALGNATDEEAIRRVIRHVGLFVIGSGEGDDEIASGLSVAKAAFAWDRVRVSRCGARSTDERPAVR